MRTRGKTSVRIFVRASLFLLLAFGFVAQQKSVHFAAYFEIRFVTDFPKGEKKMLPGPRAGGLIIANEKIGDEKNRYVVREKKSEGLL